MTYNQRDTELVMIISHPASPSRIIVLLKALRHIIENLKKKGERKERSYREIRKKESFVDQMQFTLFFYYNNIFYKNIEGEICEF